MVIPTDIQVAFCVAAFFADVGAKLIEAARRQSEESLAALYGRFRFRALAYALICVGSAATVFVLAWPSWEAQYWSPVFEGTKGNPVHALYYAVFLAALFFGASAGNWLGFRWVLAGARKRLRALYASILVLTGGLFIGHWPAPVRLGSYAEFKNDPAALPYVWEDRPFFISFCVMLLMCTVPVVIWYIQVRRATEEVR